MHVINSYRAYFQLVNTFNAAPSWQKELLLRGALLTGCKELEPAKARLRLRTFWQQQAHKLGLKAEELKTWA